MIDDISDHDTNVHTQIQIHTHAHSFCVGIVSDADLVKLKALSTPVDCSSTNIGITSDPSQMNPNGQLLMFPWFPRFNQVKAGSMDGFYLMPWRTQQFLQHKQQSTTNQVVVV